MKILKLEKLIETENKAFINVTYKTYFGIYKTKKVMFNKEQIMFSVWCDNLIYLEGSLCSLISGFLETKKDEFYI